MPLDGIDEPQDDNPFDKYNTPTSVILFPVGERGIGWERRNGAFDKINSHKAIIRLSPNGDAAHVLSVVGSGYRLVHNRELFRHVEDAMCKEMSASDLSGVRVTDKVSSLGRMCYREYVFPSIKCYIGSHDKTSVVFRLIVQNGYGGSALRVHAGAIDFWCTNGMISGDYTSTYRKHTAGLMVDGVGDVVRKSLDTFVGSQEKWQRWARTEVKHADAIQLFRDIAASAKLQETLCEQYMSEREERGQNLWAVYSALTYYASHNDGAFALRSTVEQQDTVASTMLQRELNVSQWIKSEAWHKLEYT